MFKNICVFEYGKNINTLSHKDGHNIRIGSKEEFLGSGKNTNHSEILLICYI